MNVVQGMVGVHSTGGKGKACGSGSGARRSGPAKRAFVSKLRIGESGM